MAVFVSIVMYLMKLMFKDCLLGCWKYKNVTVNVITMKSLDFDYVLASYNFTAKMAFESKLKI